MKRLSVCLLVLLAVSSVANAQRNRKTRTPQKAETRTTPKSEKRAATTIRQRTTPSADTTIPGRTVTVTSSYKPVLKSSAKINFSAATPLPDSTLPTLQYNVPSQNLFFSYQPAALKPLAADIDTGINWQNRNYLKAGFGNYTTPYLQAGLSFGDGANSVVNVNGKYTSSKGGLPFQQFSRFNGDATGIFTNGINEVTGKVFFDANTQYEYGFIPSTLKFTKDDLRRSYNSFGAKIGLRNNTVNDIGISYNPSLYVSGFTDNRNAREANLIFDAPVAKTFGENFMFKFGVTADLTGYKGDTVDKINNNLVYLSPALQYASNNFTLSGGFIPSWDNKDFHMLPNIMADIKVNEEKFVLMFGWKGYYNKTNYQYLAGFNPWIQQPTFLKSTRFIDAFAGFKGSAGSHFTYNAQLTVQHIYNQPLFVNDTGTGRSFIILNESDMHNIKLHGELGYTVQEKFSLLAGATINQYNNLTDNDKAWGLLPIDINGSLRWNVLKDLMFKADLYFWNGARYLTTTNRDADRLGGAFDLNAGAEMKITKSFSAWLQFNNLFNNKYERWNQYEVLGFQALGGVIYHF